MRLFALLVVLCARTDGHAVLSQQPGPHSEKTAKEYDLKLARVYSTAKFIDWPEQATTGNKPFVIGVLEPDPFQGGLQKLATRRIKDRAIQVVVIKSPQNYQPCHVLFIPAAAKADVVNEIVKLTMNDPVLIWRDQADPQQATGVSCAFVRQQELLVIEADPVELKRRKLAADGRLLNLNLVRTVKSSR